MAKARTYRKVKPKAKSGFLEILQAFVARRLVDLMAGFFFIVGVFSILALASYSQTDPSWNSAVSESMSVSNWGGIPGAWLADFLLQSIGAAGFCFGHRIDGLGPAYLCAPARTSLLAAFFRSHDSGTERRARFFTNSITRLARHALSGRQRRHDPDEQSRLPPHHTVHPA